MNFNILYIGILFTHFIDRWKKTIKNIKNGKTMMIMIIKTRHYEMPRFDYLIKLIQKGDAFTTILGTLFISVLVKSTLR